MFAGLTVGYLFLEVLTYLLVCLHIVKPDPTFAAYKDLMASNRPYTQFTSYGYKYTAPKVDLTTIIDGKISTAFTAVCNNYGYPSIYNYTPSKALGVHRYLVFGDSYSAGEVTDTTWVDFLQSMYQHVDSGVRIELYNVSLEAAGVLNWYLQYKDHLKQFDFDGVIFAVFGAEKFVSMDLCRPLATKHSVDNATWFAFSTQPLNSTDNFLKKAIWNSAVYPSEKVGKYTAIAIDGLKNAQFSVAPFKFYLAKYGLEQASAALKFRQFKSEYPPDTIPVFVHNKHLPDSLQLPNYLPQYTKEVFNSFIQELQTQNKKIIFISIPNLQWVYNYPKSCAQNLYCRQLQHYAQRTNTTFWNGYTMFDTVQTSSLSSYHLTGDMHWNKKACRLFAQTLFYSHLLDVNLAADSIP